MQPWHRWREPLAVVLLVALALMLAVQIATVVLSWRARDTSALLGVPADVLLLLATVAAVLWCTTPVAVGDGADAAPSRHAWPIAVAYVFPNGRLLTARWRWVAGIGGACFALFMALAMFDPSPYDPPDDSVRNPLLHNGFGEALVKTGIWVPLWLGILASLFAGALAIRLRLKRSTGVERLQTLWLAWAAQSGTTAERFTFPGDRAAVRRASVGVALERLTALAAPQ